MLEYDTPTLGLGPARVGVRVGRRPGQCAQALRLLRAQAGASAPVVRSGSRSPHATEKLCESGGNGVPGGSVSSAGQLRALLRAAAVKSACGFTGRRSRLRQAEAAAPGPGNHPVPVSCVRPFTCPPCPWCRPPRAQQEKGTSQPSGLRPSVQRGVRRETWASCTPTPASPPVSSVAFGGCPTSLGAKSLSRASLAPLMPEPSVWGVTPGAHWRPAGHLCYLVSLSSLSTGQAWLPS